MNLRPQRSEPPDINLAPLIDVVFLLLIFFMVTTTFRDEAGVKITLPEAQGEPAAESSVLTLTIDAAGTFFVNDHQVSDRQPETLRRALQAALAPAAAAPIPSAVLSANPRAFPNAAAGDRPLILKADAQTPHQAVVTAMDVASQLGLTRFSFATSRPTTAP